MGRMAACFSGLVQCIDKEPRRKQEPEYTSSVYDMSSHLRNTGIRIIHAGGREEIYRGAIPASQVMAKHPGMCVARPQVFIKPLESLLSAEEKLLPGQKYYLIPSTTARKLTRRIRGQRKVSDRSSGMSDVDVGENVYSFFSAKDLHVSRDGWSRQRSGKRQRGKKSYVPPVQKARLWRSLEWEPSLTSIQELSP